MKSQLRFLLFGLVMSLASPLALAQALLPLPLEARAQMPEEFWTPSSIKYQKQQQQISPSMSSKERALADQFYLETNFALGDLLRSGLVTYQDEVSAYVSQVADRALEKQPELREKLQFFVVYGPFPNAFATQRGTIFFNLGMIARLETEAQLAFILCHEVAHFLQNHALNRYLDYSRNLIKNEEYRRASSQAKLLLRNNYSRQQEMEADSVGYLLFRESPYGSSSVPAVFEMLATADQPWGYPSVGADWIASQTFPSTALDSLIFNDLNPNGGPTVDGSVKYVFKSYPTQPNASDSPTLAEKEESSEEDEASEEVQGEENESSMDEGEGTHPSPERRLASLRSWINTNDGIGTSAFVQPTEEFLKIRRIARLEAARAWIHEGDYADALLAVRWLEEEGENDPYLQHLKITGLYGLTATKIAHKSVKLRQDVPEEYLARAEWIKCLRLANRHLLLAATTGYFLDLYHQDSVAYEWLRPYMLHLVGSLEAYMFKEKKPKAEVVTAMETWKEDPYFLQLFEIAKTKNERERNFREYIKTREGEASYEKWKKKQERDGYSLGVDSALVFSPNFFRYFQPAFKHKKPKVKWVASERLQHGVSVNVEAIAASAGMHVELLDPQNFNTESSAQAFNDALQIQRWLDEVFRFKDSGMVPSNQTEVEAIFDRKGMGHIVLTGAISQQRYNGAWYLAGLSAPLTIFSVPLWPALTFYIFKKNEYGLFYTLLFDVRDPSLDFVYRESTKFKMSDNTMSHYLYHGLSQIKGKP